jgi:hypothetical protein
MPPRKNEDRTGAVPNPGAPAAVAAAADPASLTFVTPTEFVELPSKGKYYSETHPLHNQEAVEIRYMTAKDEDILSSKTLLKKGLAIDRFLQNVIINKQVKVDDLLVGDKNAIIVAARTTGFGADYNTKVTCLSCGDFSEHTFDLSDLDYSGNETSDEITITEDNTFLITLPTMKVEVEVRLLTGRDERFLAEQVTTRKRKKLPESIMTDQFKQFIVSINGLTDRMQIKNLVENMPTLDSHYLRIAYRKLAPNIDLTKFVECDSCGYEMEMQVPFTADFFWPKQ